jgi:hypothetical protein
MNMVRITGTNIEVEPLSAIPEAAGVPPELQSRPADALRIPLGFLGIANPAYFNRGVFARFSRVVRLASNGGLYIRESVGLKHFASPSIEDTLYYTKDHPSRAGLARYRWFTDPADGVEYGFLNEQ